MKLTWLPTELLALAILAVLFATASACAVARPFSRLGARTAGSITGDVPETVTVVITHAVLDNSKRRSFDAYTRRLVDAMDRGEIAGLLGFTVRKQLFGNQVWTMTAWSDREASKRFATSGLHRAAMAQAGEAIQSMRVRHIDLARATVPLSWKRALWHLEQPENKGGR